MNPNRVDAPKTTLTHKQFKRYIDVYICIYPYIFCIYASLQKTSLLFIRVNTFYSTITITTVYIPNQKTLIIYQEDDGREQSMNYDQEVCNNMLDVTAVLYMYVCMHASACECVNTYPTAPPSDINAHTQRK